MNRFIAGFLTILIPFVAVKYWPDGTQTTETTQSSEVARNDR